MQSSKEFIKRFALKKCIRFLHGEVAKLRGRLTNAVNDAFQMGNNDKAVLICSAMEKSFQKASEVHKERLGQKLKFLRSRRMEVQRSITTEKSDKVEHIVTDLTKSLNEDELELLSKGPKFTLSGSIDEIEMTANFCSLANRLQWQQFRSSKPQDETVPESRPPFPKFPNNEHVYAPPRIDLELKSKLSHCFSQLKELVNELNTQSPKGNLSREEKLTLKTLGTKPLTFLPSDKGSEFCIIENSAYDEAARAHLNNNAVYIPIKSMSARTIENKINQVWKRQCRKNSIPTQIMKSYVTTNSDLPVFYHLVKTHKEGPSLKIRPIISNRRGPTHKISWLLSRLLKPLLNTVPAHLENSKALIDEISNMSENALKKFNYPFSLDVVSLYTSIPTTDAIEVIEDKLRSEFKEPLPFDPEQIAEMLHVITQNTFFCYKQSIFKQQSGLPMGNSVSAILAILFMDKLERQVIDTCQQIGLYKRYIDDTIILTTDRETAIVIFDKMNKLSQNIKFEIEHPDDDNNLSLLDFNVMIIDGKTSFRFYKKLAKKNTFPHERSAIPRECKNNTIKNEMKRIVERCSSKSEQKEQCKQFEERLVARGYEKTQIPNKRKRRREVKEKDVHYMEFPFINDTVHRKVKRIFQSAKLPVRIFCKNKNLRSRLQQKQTIEPCTLKECSLDNRMCLKKNCVYSMKCTKCGEQYIGSTKRALHQRVKEHLHLPTSSVFQHKSNCSAEFEVSILARDNSIGRLRLKEAIHIRKSNPAINSKAESEELLDLIF